MRWHILRTLLHKEVLRHLANRGGLAMIALLIVAAMLLSFFGTRDGGMSGLAPGVKRCYVDYWEDGPLIAHLKNRVPAALKDQICFRPSKNLTTDDQGRIVYQQNTGAIQIRPGPQICFWHPGSDGTALAPFEAWFWKESLRYSLSYYETQTSAGGLNFQTLTLMPVTEPEHLELGGSMDSRSGLTTSLILFGIFFVCVYLLPSLTCEERERGVLLAQALSPASPGEILAAKFLFYPVLAILLAAVLAGTYQPRVLADSFFWLALIATVFGAMGVGLTIASLARTQRAASMGAMCYMLAVALLVFICQQNGILGLPYLALEFHCPRMLHAALTDAVHWYHFLHLLLAFLLGAVWTGTATLLFRRRGWQ
jgi:ABC-2 type transporter